MTEADKVRQERDQWKDEALRLRAKKEALRKALEPFAMIGDASDYGRLPQRLDVPFAWCETARKVLEVAG